MRGLARGQGESLVSCYVPFARAGKDVRQNGIQLKRADECVTLDSATPLASLVTIAPRYYLVPLVSETTMPPLLVLALSRHVVRLIDGATARRRKSSFCHPAYRAH